MSAPEPAAAAPEAAATMPLARLRLADPVRPVRAAETPAAWGDSVESERERADFYRQATPPHHGQP